MAYALITIRLALTFSDVVPVDAFEERVCFNLLDSILSKTIFLSRQQPITRRRKDGRRVIIGLLSFFVFFLPFDNMCKNRYLVIRSLHSGLISMPLSKLRFF